MTPRPVRRSLIALAALACAPSMDGSTEPIVRVPDEIYSPRCSIVARTVATLEVPADSSDAQPLFVRVDSQHRYWVVRTDGDLPVLFDSTGRFLQVIGRRGRGPGEFEGVVSLLIVGRDSILAFDRSRRGVWLDSNAVARGDIRLPMVPHVPVALSWPDVVVGSGTIPFQESKGPLYHLSFEATQPTVLAQFFLADMGDNPEMMLYTWHHLSTPRRGRFWGMWSRRYDLAESTSA